MVAIICFAVVGLLLSSSLGSVMINEDDDDGIVNDSIISTEDLLEALKIGRKYVEDLERLEADLILHSREGLNDKSKHHHDYSRYRSHSPEAVAQSKIAAVELIARKHLSEKFGVPVDQINLDEVAEHSTQHHRNKRATVCSGPYGSLTGSRTIDGTCNTLENPDYGKSNSIYQRLIPPVYSDGVGSVRSAPLARTISNTVLFNESLPDYSNTLLVMPFGQFLDHDIIDTPTFRLANSAIRCCNGSQFGNTISPAPHPECLPIMLPPNDPLYGPSNCMNFVRSTFGTNLDGSTPPYRQSINTNTHWIDGSMIYGSDDTSAAALRNTSGKGLLATSGSRNLLPVLNTCCPGDPTNSCAAAQSCFFAGDSRVVEHPFLTVIHTIWVREHNRIANMLYNSNPVLSDEAIFQQARKIVIAELQHIIYSEYLPTIIGSSLASAVYNGTYGPIFSVTPNPAVYTEFSTAAFRMGHSQVKSYMRVINSNGGVNTTLSFFLGDAFNVGGFRLLDPNFIDGALRGMLMTPVQKVDNCFADDITSQVFRVPGRGNLGFDLVARNIQRGRDHGIPPYSRFWKNTNFANVNPNAPANFDSLAITHTQEVIAYLKSVYPTVNDIDLYIGGVTEIPLAGALVGPTFANIFAKQFDNLKQADRFFYNIAVKSGTKVPQFTAAQLAEIKKVTFSRIICDNSDKSITTIQPQAFLAADAPNNLPIPCSSIPSMNPAVWSLA